MPEHVHLLAETHISKIETLEGRPEFWITK
jgi:hypothetical protein